MKNRGIVKNINNNTITIEIFNDISCSHCSSCDSKTHSVQTFKYYQNDLTEGDMIEFSINDKQLLKLGLLVYISPIIFMISFYFIASYFNLSESKKIICAFVGLVINLLIIFFIDKIKGNQILNNIKITKEKN